MCKITKARYRNHGCRIIDDLVYKGIRTIILENELIRIGILVDKGTDIFEFLYKPTDTDFLLRSPIGLSNRNHFTETVTTDQSAFLDYYHGGWQEIFPGGGPDNYRGAKLGLHGEVAHLSWDYNIIRDDPETISVKFSVECIRTPFKLEKTLTLKKGVPVLFINEDITNLSSSTQEFMWGHHPAFGAPFLNKEVKIFTSALEAEVHKPKFAKSGILEPGISFKWPETKVNGQKLDLSKVQDKDAGFSELLYLKGLSEGWYALVDQEKEIGLGFAWPKKIFPYLWFWLVYGKAPGYPWWNRLYCIALEPWSSIPNNFTEAKNKDTLIKLEGGEKLSINFSTVVITGKKEIKSVRLDGSFS